MTIQDLADSGLFVLDNEGDEMDREITKCLCCDLLSVAMGKAPAGCAWVTVMGNMNTLAVASLTDTACVIMAEGVLLDQTAATKAKMQGIAVFRTELPIFDAALAIHRMLLEQAGDKAGKPMSSLEAARQGL